MFVVDLALLDAVMMEHLRKMHKCEAFHRQLMQ
jgi:hypothetical protein